MIQFSADPVVAEQEMRAVIYYLAAFGFVDGDFDATERTFIQRFVRQLVESRAEAAMSVSPDLRHLAVERWAKHFDEVIEEVIHEIQVHAHEPVADGEDSRNFVMAKVKLRCFELFKRFDEASRARLLTSAEWLIQADGVVHPAELQFRDEVHALLDAPVELDDTAIETVSSGVVEVTGATRLPPPDYDHEFLTVGEWDYARTPEEFARQADRDIFLANKVIARLDAMRAQGEGRAAPPNSASARRDRGPSSTTTRRARSPRARPNAPRATKKITAGRKTSTNRSICTPEGNARALRGPPRKATARFATRSPRCKLCEGRDPQVPSMRHDPPCVSFVGLLLRDRGLFEHDRPVGSATC